MAGPGRAWHFISRQEPGPGLGELVPGPEEAGQRHGDGGERDDHPAGQDPRRRSERPRNEARDGDGKYEVPHAKGLDGHPPVSVVL
jgi:hypothetical protein